MKPQIMVVDDEIHTITMMRYNLEQAGYDVLEADNGVKALALIEQANPDLVLLDWMLPGMSGLDVCRTVRQQPELCNVSIIMVTARDTVDDKVSGFDLGIDDYVTKPFFIAEVLARIKAILVRRGEQSNRSTLVEAEGVCIDVKRRQVTRDGHAVNLRPTEFRLLLLMMRHPGIVFTRGSLVKGVWGPRIHVELRTIDVHIRRLRKALRENGTIEDLVRTVHGEGYAFGRLPPSQQ